MNTTLIYSRVLIWHAVLVLVAGCATNQSTPVCDVPAESIKALQQQSVDFLESQGVDTHCEEISDQPEFVPEYGCGLFGNATNDGINPRTGKQCPAYLDGGYWVIFDPNTLKPSDVVLVAW